MSYNEQFHQKIIAHNQVKSKYPIIDTHLHFVDFWQDSDGMKKLLNAMDKAGIKKAVVAGLPLTKKWEASEPDPPHYYLDDNAKCYYFTSTDEILARAYQALSEKSKKRIAPMLCGFNPTDKNAVHHVDRKLKENNFWKGIGEILCRHDDLTNLTMEETSRANHPALFPIYELAASKNLPILIHHNSTSVGLHDKFEYLHEMTIALASFPKTRFVWAHGGLSRRIFHKNYTKMLDEVLKMYKNLHVDISWVGYDEVICENLKPKVHWVKLIEKYPDRFLIGSDTVGHFENLGRTIARYNNLLGILKPKTRARITQENAEHVWNF